MNLPHFAEKGKKYHNGTLSYNYFNLSELLFDSIPFIRKYLVP